MKIFQPIVTGSLIVSGGVYFPSLFSSSDANSVVMLGSNGRLYITSSDSIGGGGAGIPGGSANQIQYNSASVFGGVDKLTYDGVNLQGTGSFTGSFAGEFLGTVSSATTASYSSNFTIANSVSIGSSLTKAITYNSTIVGSNNLFEQFTGSYTSAHGKYTLYKSNNARAGEFVTVWNGTTTKFFDNSTEDIGSTSDITFSSVIVGADIQINAVAASSGWTIKMLITYL